MIRVARVWMTPHASCLRSQTCCIDFQPVSQRHRTPRQEKVRSKKLGIDDVAVCVGVTNSVAASSATKSVFSGVIDFDHY